MSAITQVLCDIRKSLFELKLISSVDGEIFCAANVFNREEVKKLYLSGERQPTPKQLRECKKKAKIKAHYLYLKGAILKRLSGFFSESRLQKGNITFRSHYVPAFSIKEVEKLKKLVKKLFFLYFFHTSVLCEKDFSFINCMMGTLECMSAHFKGSKSLDVAWEKFNEAVKMYFKMEEKMPFFV